MITKAIDRIVDLAKPEIFTFEGKNYSNKKLDIIAPPAVPALQTHTLTSLVDFLVSRIPTVSTAQLIIHVVSSSQVNLFGLVDAYGRRPCYVSVVHVAPNSHQLFGIDLAFESMIINIQTNFVDTEERARMLKILGNITEENSKTSADDGVTQRVTVKQGNALVSEVSVANPFIMQMRRSFPEVEQAESAFILRIRKGGSASLFEVVGSDCEVKQIEIIKAYLKDQLTEAELDVAILA